MPALDVPAIIREMLELTGESQGKLAKRLGVSQSNVSKWLAGQQPNKVQWDRIRDVYFQLKGWRWSLDEKIESYDEEMKARIHDLIDQILKIAPPPRRK